MSRRRCRKVRYLTKFAAEISAQAQFVRKGRWLRVYECPRCEGWHLATIPPVRPPADDQDEVEAPAPKVAP